MKKFLIIIMSLFMVVGCSCKNEDSASASVEKYLDRYRNNESVVMDELDSYIAKEELSDTQKDVYRDVLQRQYKDLKYKVTDEKYDGDTAVVTVKITVYDLYKVQKDADKYLAEHPEEFNDETDSYDKTIFINYKLDEMKKNTDTVEYTLEVNVKKEDGKWKVEQLNESDLEKIHGIYNYES